MKIVQFTFLFWALLASCGQPVQNNSSTDPLTMKHDSLLGLVRSDEGRIASNMKNAVLNPSLASSAAQHYTLFARDFPKDTNSPMFLFKAADIYCNAMKQYDQAVELLEKIIRDYPGFRKLPACYFQLGVIYDDNLNEDDKAKGYYEAFLQKFPNSPIAPQVKTLISYLGKSNDELMKEFRDKNGEK